MVIELSLKMLRGIRLRYCFCVYFVFLKGISVKSQIYYVCICMYVCANIYISFVFFSIGMTFFGFANHNPLWLNKNCQTIFYVFFCTMNKYEQKNIRNANIRRYTFIQPLLYTITLILYSFKRFFWLLFFFSFIVGFMATAKKPKNEISSKFPYGLIWNIVSLKKTKVYITRKWIEKKIVLQI